MCTKRLLAWFASVCRSNVGWVYWDFGCSCCISVLASICYTCRILLNWRDWNFAVMHAIWIMYVFLVMLNSWIREYLNTCYITLPKLPYRFFQSFRVFSTFPLFLLFITALSALTQIRIYFLLFIFTKQSFNTNIAYIYFLWMDFFLLAFWVLCIIGLYSWEILQNELLCDNIFYCYFFELVGYIGIKSLLFWDYSFMKKF